MDTPDLDALAAAAAQGDLYALTALIQATQRDVSRFLARISHRRDIDDMTQETFLRAFRSLPGFEGRSSVRTWLFAIARRVAVDAERHASARPRNAARVDGESVDFRQPASFEEQHALRDLLAGLSPDRREAFVLTHVAGLSYLEAAEVCGCPVGTIRSRVARAREDLVIALGDARPRRRTAS
ncbi:sigma-70 family RNA polymerase sigma factor [Micromonosporaceae bacterium Da 78-11]